MAMTEDERDAFLAEITLKHEAWADRVFRDATGFTFRGNDVPSHRAEISHGEKNGDSSQHPPDSWARIQRDFPDVFGTADADA